MNTITQHLLDTGLKKIWYLTDDVIKYSAKERVAIGVWDEVAGKFLLPIVGHLQGQISKQVKRGGQ